MLDNAEINFCVSSKLLPYICKIFSTFWSEVSKSFNAAVVKKRDIKFVLYKSNSSPISLNSTK